MFGQQPRIEIIFKHGDRVKSEFGRKGTVVDCFGPSFYPHPVGCKNWRIKFDDGEYDTYCTEDLSLLNDEGKNV
jgi:hypothetical protein